MSTSNKNDKIIIFFATILLIVFIFLFFINVTKEVKVFQILIFGMFGGLVNKYISGKANITIPHTSFNLNASGSKAFIIIIYLAASYFYLFIFKNNSFNYTIFVKFNNNLKISDDFPNYIGDTIILQIGTNRIPKIINSNLDVDFKEINIDYKDKIVPVEFKSKYWKSTIDSIQLSETNNTIIVTPNSLLSSIKGIVKFNNKAIEGATITFSDTTITTDSAGKFSFSVPLSKQNLKYKFEISKSGFQSKTGYYIPETNETGVYLLIKK